MGRGTRTTASEAWMSYYDDDYEGQAISMAYDAMMLGSGDRLMAWRASST